MTTPTNKDRLVKFADATFDYVFDGEAIEIEVKASEAERLGDRAGEVIQDLQETLELVLETLKLEQQLEIQYDPDPLYSMGIKLATSIGAELVSVPEPPGDEGVVY